MTKNRVSQVAGSLGKQQEKRGVWISLAWKIMFEKLL